MSLSSAYYSFLHEGRQDAAIRGAFIADLLGNQKTTILEPHAGDGALSMELSSRGFTTTALEEDPVLFAVFLEKFRLQRELKPFLSPLPINITNLDSNIKWGLIVLSNAISFIDDQTLTSYLKKINQLLTVDGLLVLNSPQPTPLREEQPKAEIYKKIFGANVIKQFASSIFLDKRRIKVEYEYQTFSSNQKIVDSTITQVIHLRDVKSLSALLEKMGFAIKEIFSDWSFNELEDSSPNCVLVARKISEFSENSE